MANERPVDILLVEDNPGDIVLITDIIKDLHASAKMHVARDGIEAAQFLHKAGVFKDSPRPEILILDLNLPRKDGRDLLADVKSDPELRRIPVIVLSGSNSPADIATCYDLCANCYLVKPLDLPGLTDVVRSLVDFWLTKVKLPPNGA